MTTRQYWLTMLEQLARPLLYHVSNGTLKTNMSFQGDPSRRAYTHLEGFARLLLGIAPWLEGDGGSPAERQLRDKYRDYARRGIAQAVTPGSPDYMNFSRGSQPLVDAAFLAHALLRAPNQLLQALPEDVKQNLAARLKQTRAIRPNYNNWLLFSAMVEAGLFALTGNYDPVRVDYAILQHQQWYKGDGSYGDGPSYRWDYYNSFVIQPMLITLLDVFHGHCPQWDELKQPTLERAQRYGEVLEALIAKDGTFPPLGRSITYRCGAFQLLAQLALEHRLPASLPPAQVRCALTAVIRACLEAEGTFDENGWLQIGLWGHQPQLGEGYICTGSLYLTSAVFLPLGLSELDPFWADGDLPWTASRLWQVTGQTD